MEMNIPPRAIWERTPLVFEGEEIVPNLRPDAKVTDEAKTVLRSAGRMKGLILKHNEYLNGLRRRIEFELHWISLSTWDLGLEEIRAISDFAL